MQNLKITPKHSPTGNPSQPTCFTRSSSIKTIAWHLRKVQNVVSKLNKRKRLQQQLLLPPPLRLLLLRLPQKHMKPQVNCRWCKTATATSCSSNNNNSWSTNAPISTFLAKLAKNFNIGTCNIYSTSYAIITTIIILFLPILPFARTNEKPHHGRSSIDEHHPR